MWLQVQEWHRLKIVNKSRKNTILKKFLESGKRVSISRSFYERMLMYRRQSSEALKALDKKFLHYGFKSSTLTTVNKGSIPTLN